VKLAMDLSTRSPWVSSNTARVIDDQVIEVHHDAQRYAGRFFGQVADGTQD
jgi:hypothetical protein